MASSIKKLWQTFILYLPDDPVYKIKINLIHIDPLTLIIAVRHKQVRFDPFFWTPARI